jgi:hypothetical protein
MMDDERDDGYVAGSFGDLDSGGRVEPPKQARWTDNGCPFAVGTDRLGCPYSLETKSASNRHTAIIRQMTHKAHNNKPRLATGLAGIVYGPRGCTYRVPVLSVALVIRASHHGQKPTVLLTSVGLVIPA